jgi:potassium-transporting ATPase KdpC subunit
MKTIFISIKIFLVMTILTGIMYPLFITVIGQTIFHDRSNGSLIVVNNTTVGSELIGQKFTGDQYFSSRPSAIDYNPMPSGGSNLSVTSIELKLRIKRNTAAFDSVNQIPQSQTIPSEMLCASGSGLDPHISPEAALLQVKRICKCRNLSESANGQIENLIAKSTEGRQLGFLGEERVNVLKLNLELDKQFFVK